jgi:mRNA interferase RelE/StbE
MTYELRFLPSALKEWEKLGHTLRAQFKKKLAERLQRPRVEADRLREADLRDCYKIKLRSAGYRLVYRVDDTAVTVVVVTVGKRNHGDVYEVAADRRPEREPGDRER